MFKKYKTHVIVFLISLIGLSFTSYLYWLKIQSFSFVDEYDHIIAGYFMLKGKTLFTEIFHNRQFGPVYISYFIQYILHPNSLYQLILYHRLFVILLSLIGGIFLSIRFGKAALIAVFLYEIIKYYSFGNLFQGEGLIVYPALYLLNVFWAQIKKQKLYTFDYLLASLACFFIVVMRETFIPVALFFLITITFFGRKKKQILIVPILTTTLITIVFAILPIKDYVRNVYGVNSTGIFSSEVNIVRTLFYPFFLLFTGKLTYLKIVLSLMDVGFLILFIHQLVFNKKILQSAMIFIILALSALRPVVPGTMFYGAYKMIMWNAFLIQIAVLLFNEVKKEATYLRWLPATLIVFAFLYAIFSPQSIIWQKEDKQKNFNISYNHYFVNGEVIKILADPGDTLFVDGYDSLLYWQANIPSSYKYSIYYVVANSVPYYADERINMFKTNPPVFYFRDCITLNKQTLPAFIEPRYVNLNNMNSKHKGSCLYIRKDKMLKLTDKQKTEIQKFKFSL